MSGSLKDPKLREAVQKMTIIRKNQKFVAMMNLAQEGGHKGPSFNVKRSESKQKKSKSRSTSRQERNIERKYLTGVFHAVPAHHKRQATSVLRQRPPRHTKLAELYPSRVSSPAEALAKKRMLKALDCLPGSQAKSKVSPRPDRSTKVKPLRFPPAEKTSHQQNEQQPQDPMQQQQPTDNLNHYGKKTNVPGQSRRKRL